MSGILNAVGNATTALATLGGINQPGTLAAPSTIVSNIAVPGVPLISFRDYFLTTMESWVATIPLRTQFIAIIQSFPASLTTSTLQSLEPVKAYDGSAKGWDIDNARTALTNYPLQGVVGCIFLDGVEIPNETLTAGTATIDNNRGFVQGSILENRDAFSGNNLTLRFRETNTSFTDMIMRPWVILGAHKGFVFRGPVGSKESIKTNITIMQYSRTYQNVSQIPRKVWQYYDCVPLSVDNRSLSYEGESYEAYGVPFLYNYYTVSDNLYIPLPDIIKSISNGNIPRISPFQR